MTTNTWQVTVYNPDGYFYERIWDGLTLTFDCYAPCETCEADQTTCTSCNTIYGRNILYLGECLDVCPSSTYYDESRYTCELCEEECLECEQYDGDICTACDPYSYWPFLDANTCKHECPFGSFGDYQLA